MDQKRDFKHTNLLEYFYIFTKYLTPYTAPYYPDGTRAVFRITVCITQQLAYMWELAYMWDCDNGNSKFSVAIVYQNSSHTLHCKFYSSRWVHKKFIWIVHRSLLSAYYWVRATPLHEYLPNVCTALHFQPTANIPITHFSLLSST